MYVYTYRCVCIYIYRERERYTYIQHIIRYHNIQQIAGIRMFSDLLVLLSLVLIG